MVAKTLYDKLWDTHLVQQRDDHSRIDAVGLRFREKPESVPIGQHGFASRFFDLDAFQSGRVEAQQHIGPRRRPLAAGCGRRLRAGCTLPLVRMPGCVPS